jgi:NADP-dependent 3-hydroxy acid dehydrogenase YdfG
VSKLFDLGGKHVLVTGASSGLGRHFACALAAAGAVLSLGARRADALAETMRTVGADRAQGLVMDVTDAPSIERAFDNAEARLGPVTVLINK